MESKIQKWLKIFFPSLTGHSTRKKLNFDHILVGVLFFPIAVSTVVSLWVYLILALVSLLPQSVVPTLVPLLGFYQFFGLAEVPNSWAWLTINQPLLDWMHNVLANRTWGQLIFNAVLMLPCWVLEIFFSFVELFLDNTLFSIPVFGPLIQLLSLGVRLYLFMFFLLFHGVISALGLPYFAKAVVYSETLFSSPFSDVQFFTYLPPLAMFNHRYFPENLQFLLTSNQEFLVNCALFAAAFITLVLGILLSIAYLTVLERKVLGGVQRREGPTQVGPLGFFQAIADAIKLLSKESISPTSSNRLVFFIFPLLIFTVSLFIWAAVPVLPGEAPLVEVDLFFLLLFAVSTVHVYLLALAAWSGVSRYSFAGSLRTVAQMLSYDVVMAIALAPAVILSNTLNPFELVQYQADSTWIVFQAPISFVIMVIVSLAETNRPPFDLPEAESELVAGALTEYSSTNFVFFFIAEYSHILLSCHVLVLTFLGGWHPPFFDFSEFLFHLNIDSPVSVWLFSFFIYHVKLLCTMLIFFLARASLPRYRYDQLMELAWKRLLPIALGNLVLIAAWVYLL